MISKRVHARQNTCLLKLSGRLLTATTYNVPTDYNLLQGTGDMKRTLHDFHVRTKLRYTIICTMY